MLSSLHVDGKYGKYFREPDGKRWFYVSISAFSLFKRWLMTDGPAALVLPNLTEYRQIAHEGGYLDDIVLRVFRFANEPNPFALDPWAYTTDERGGDRRMRAVQHFTEFCNDRGFRIDWTGGDAQTWMVDGPLGRQEHTHLFCRELAFVKGTNFIQGLNEPWKNGGLEGFDLPQWGDYLRSSGAGPTTVLDFLNFHPDRGTEGAVDKWVGKPVESAPFLWQQGPSPVADEMMGFDETASGSRSTNPEYALLMGAAIPWLGVNFHSTAGIRGDAFGPVTRQCAVNFFRGVAGGVSACRAAGL